MIPDKSRKLQNKQKRRGLLSLLPVVLSAILMLVLLTCCDRPDPTPESSGAENTETETDVDESLTAYDGTDLKVTFLNAGKADVIVIRHGDSVTMIDTGLESEKDTMTDYLDSQGIENIVRLFLTHYDRDHIGGVPALLDHCTVKEVYVTSIEAKSTDEAKVCKSALAKASITPEIIRGDKEIYTEDHLCFQIDGPQKKSYLKDTSNNSSLVIRLTYAGHSFLFLGDALEERIDEITGQGRWSAEVVKMPHHGDYEKNLGTLLDEVKPRIAVITCSDKEREEKKTEDLLSDRGIKTFLTRKGTVTITVEEDRIRDTQKD